MEKEFDNWYPNSRILSSCCGEPFNEDIGICKECGEHCEGIEFDEDGNEIEK